MARMLEYCHSEKVLLVIHEWGITPDRIRRQRRIGGSFHGWPSALSTTKTWTADMRRASLIQGTLKPSGDGVTGSQVGIVRVDGNARRAYVKRLPVESCAAEAYCALLLRSWGLSVPEPLWIEHDGEIWFGSLDAEYPSLKQRFQIGQQHPPEIEERLIDMACAVAVNFSSTGLACSADEAIGNTDRNFGNILWDGGDPSWIDHERALGLIPGDDNKLARMAIRAGKGVDVQRSAIAAALTLARDVLQEVESSVPVDTRHFSSLVATRLASLGNLVDARFPPPQHDLFSQR